MKTSPFLLTLCAIAPALSGFAAEPSKGLLLVTNKGDRTLSLVDPVANQQLATVPEEGVTGHEIAASVDGKRAFVPIFGNSGVGKPGTDGQVMQVIDLEKRAIVGSLDFGKGVRPHCPVMCAKNGLLYLTTENENCVCVIDPATLKILDRVSTGQEQSHMLAVTRDGRRGYTANVGPGTVSVLDLEEKKLLKVIPISKTTQRISLSIDDRWVFTSDQTKPQLVVIDTQTNEVAQRIDLPDFGYGTAATPDGKTLLVCCGIGDLAVVDLDAKKVVRTLQLPRAPQEVLVRPDGAVAYVSCDASAKIGVIDLKEWKVSTLIDVGKTADGLAWATAE